MKFKSDAVMIAGLHIAVGFRLGDFIAINNTCEHRRNRVASLLISEITTL